MHLLIDPEGKIEATELYADAILETAFHRDIDELVIIGERKHMTVRLVTIKEPTP